MHNFVLCLAIQAFRKKSLATRVKDFCYTGRRQLLMQVLRAFPSVVWEDSTNSVVKSDVKIVQFVVGKDFHLNSVGEARDTVGVYKMH